MEPTRALANFDDQASRGEAPLESKHIVNTHAHTHAHRRNHLSRCIHVRAGEAQHSPSVGTPLERRFLLNQVRLHVMRGEGEGGRWLFGSKLLALRRLSAHCLTIHRGYALKNIQGGTAARNTSRLFSRQTRRIFQLAELRKPPS